MARPRVTHICILTLAFVASTFTFLFLFSLTEASNYTVGLLIPMENVYYTKKGIYYASAIKASPWMKSTNKTIFYQATTSRLFGITPNAKKTRQSERLFTRCTKPKFQPLLDLVALVTLQLGMRLRSTFP